MIAAAPIGLGCMGMSFAYQADPGSELPADLLRAVIASGTPERPVLLDTADVYGNGENESLVGAALAEQPDAFVLVGTKVGMVAEDGNGFASRPDGRPAHVRAAVEASLARLGLECLPLCYLHRVDPDVPVEETWGALADLATEGKVNALGISNVSVDQLETVHALHRVAAVQGELSLVVRSPMDGVVPWCESNDVSFVAYGPVTRGLMAGSVGPDDTFAESDVRSRMPLFAPESRQRRQEAIALATRVAEEAGASVAQVTLRRLLDLSPAVMAIPGTRRVSRWDENRASEAVGLTDGQRATLDRAGALLARDR